MFRPPAKLLALAAAQLLSVAGDRIHYLALVSLITAGIANANPGPEIGLAYLAAAMFLPTILFAPLAGPLIDRLSLVAVLVVTDACRGLVVLTMPTLFDLGGSRLLLLGVFVLFTLNVFFLPARGATPPRLVPAERLHAANAFLILVAVVATVVATAVGGWIVDYIGWRSVLYLDGGTYLVSALLLLSLRGIGAPSPRRQKQTYPIYLKEVASGFVFLARSAVARQSTIAWLALWVAGGVLHVAAPGHVQTRPGEMFPVGLVITAMAAGVGLGTLWAMRHRGASGNLVLSAGLLLAASALAIFAASTELVFQCAAGLAAGVAIGPLMASSETGLQLAAGERRRARVFAARDFLARWVFLLASAAAAAASGLWSGSIVLTLGAVLLALAGIGLLFYGSRRNPGQTVGESPGRS